MSIFGKYVDSLKKLNEIQGQPVIPGQYIPIVNIHQYGQPAYFVNDPKDHDEIRKMIETQWDHWREDFTVATGLQGAELHFRLPRLDFLLGVFGNHTQISNYLANLNPGNLDLAHLNCLLSIHDDPSLNILHGNINRARLYQSFTTNGFTPLPGTEVQFTTLLGNLAKEYNDNWTVVPDHVYQGMKEIVYSQVAHPS